MRRKSTAGMAISQDIAIVKDHRVGNLKDSIMSSERFDGRAACFYAPRVVPVKWEGKFQPLG